MRASPAETGQLLCHEGYMCSGPHPARLPRDQQHQTESWLHAELSLGPGNRVSLHGMLAGSGGPPHRHGDLYTQLVTTAWAELQNA